MKAFTQQIVALAVAAMLAVAPTLSRAEKVSKVLPDYTVFLDPPTGFVFVKLPGGWKFVGKVEAKDIAQVPASVVTALLTGDDDSDETGRMALQEPR